MKSMGPPVSHGTGRPAPTTSSPLKRGHKMPAVDRDRRARHPFRCHRSPRAGTPRRDPPVCRDGAEGCGGSSADPARSQVIRVDVGRDIARRQRIHADPVACPLEGENLGPLHHAGLRDHVRRRPAYHASPRIEAMLTITPGRFPSRQRRAAAEDISQTPRRLVARMRSNARAACRGRDRRPRCPHC